MALFVRVLEGVAVLLAVAVGGFGLGVAVGVKVLKKGVAVLLAVALGGTGLGVAEAAAGVLVGVGPLQYSSRSSTLKLYAPELTG